MKCRTLALVARKRSRADLAFLYLLANSSGQPDLFSKPSHPLKKNRLFACSIVIPRMSAALSFVSLGKDISQSFSFFIYLSFRKFLPSFVTSKHVPARHTAVRHGGIFW